MEPLHRRSNFPAKKSGRLRAPGRRLFFRASSCAVLGLCLGACTDSVLRGDAFSYTGRYFTLERPDVTLGSGFERVKEKETTAFTDSKTQKDTITHEIDFRTQGWIYHPALAVYSIDLRPKFEFETFESAGEETRDTDATFFGYTIDTTILQFKPYTLRLTSSRDESRTSGTLAEDTTVETANDRAQLHLKYQPVPTRVTVERRKTETDAIVDTRTTTSTARVESEHRTNKSISFAQVEAVRENRQVQTSSSTVDRFALSGRNTYSFDNDLRLSSSLITNRTAFEDRNSSNLSLAEHLSWRHADNLRSRYQLRWNRRTNDDFVSDTVAGSAALTHQLYENLITSVNTDASAGEFSNGSNRNYGASLDFRYRRPIPWGKIRVTNGYRYRIDDDRIDPVVTQVLDESHTLAGTNTAFLERDNVDAGSIVVTDAAGLVTFVENVDYVVRTSGSSVGIERIAVGSAIADGQTVLVDYNFTPNPPHKTGRRTIKFGVGLSLWNTLDTFYDFSHTKDTLLSGTAPSSLADDRIQRTGARLSWNWSRTSVEYEQRDTTRTPLNRFTAREIVSFRLLRDLSMGGSVSYSKTHFTDTGDTTTNVDATANARWQAFRWAYITAKGFAGRVRGTTQEIDRKGADASLQWRYGLWSGDIKAGFLREDDILNGRSRDQTVFLVTLKRKLWE